MNGWRAILRALTVSLLLMTEQLRAQPARLLVTVCAIALGVALGAAVYLVNTAALDEFGAAAKRLVGEADIVIRGSREGFSEQLYVQISRNASVAAASPVIELEMAVPGSRDTLKVIGIDPFRAASLQPSLIADLSGGIVDLFQPDSIYLSAAAAEQRHLRRGAELPVLIGNAVRPLRVIGILANGTYSQALGVMDIAAAQWTFGHVGLVNRIDVRVVPGVNVAACRAELARSLPPGVFAVSPEVERDRAVTVTRAYRVNLNMLALVALWTGAFLVFSTQSLSVLRRRKALALLRSLGVTRTELQGALIAEGAVLGALGSLFGMILGFLLATVTLRLLTGDLGNGQLHAAGATLRATPSATCSLFIIGVAVACAGAWLPARSASRIPPAIALKGGDARGGSVSRTSWRLAASLLASGAALAFLPSVGALPLFGYAAIALLLFGAVLLVPTFTEHLLRLAPVTNRPILDIAIAQLRDSVRLATLSLASIIVSFSLMVAMAIMVDSFRTSFDHWLIKLLPADMQLREPLGNDTAYWTADDQSAMAATAGVSRIEFRRTRQILLDAARPPVTLIARNESDAAVAADLPLLQSAPQPMPASRPLPASLPGAWISESLQDLYGYKLGGIIELPLGGRARRYRIAGIWRDYARAFGAVAISRNEYIAATGDRSATEGSVWLAGHASAAQVEAALRARSPRGDAIDILASSTVRERSLQLFDRAFAITYALEIIAVIIGLTGVSFAASSTALARRAEFGMLRHLGLRKRDVMGVVASEGTLTSLFGVIYGLLLGVALSLVLVYVVNRQSFNWSIDLDVPVRRLASLSAALIAAAALTAIWSGRAAMSRDAVRAVREDW